MNNISPSTYDKGTIKQYVWISNKDKDKAFKIDIIEASSCDEADEVYKDLVSNNNINANMENSDIFGKHSYINICNNKTSYILFLKDKIVIRLYSIGDKIIDCKKFAEYIYAILE